VLSELIAVGSNVPGLGNQLHPRKDRVLAKRIEKTRTRIEVLALTSKGHAEIEAEAVNVKRRDPIAQRIRHHLQYARMRQVQRVAGAGVTDAMASIARHQPVIARIVEAAERQGGPELAAFRSVVVDDIEDDLDASRVQPSDGNAHFGGRAGREIARLDGEESDRVVAPVVLKALLQQMAILHEGVDRHQFDRRDAEFPQIFDHVLVGECCEGAALARVHLLVQHGEPAQMRFVDDGIGPRDCRGTIVSPVERLIGDDGLEHAGRAVAPVE
jgi:hypothetical protein